MKNSTVALPFALLIVLLGSLLIPTSRTTASSATTWKLASEPTRVVFQTVRCQGDSCQSATLFGDGRVELWQENPRAPAFREEVRWLEKSDLVALGSSAIAKGLPEWGDDSSFARFKRSGLDRDLQKSGDVRTSVLLVLHSPDEERDLVRFFQIPSHETFSPALSAELPELAWASQWAKLLLDPDKLASASSNSSLPNFQEAQYELPVATEEKVLEIKSTAMDMTTTELTVQANGQMTYKVSRKETVSRQLTAHQLTRLLGIAIANGLAEWHEPTLTAKVIRLNSGRAFVAPQDEPTFGLALQLARYQRGSYQRHPLVNKAIIVGPGFYRHYFPEIQEYQGLESLRDYVENMTNAENRSE